ncbi:hypothetical protein [Pseudomonas putida]|uniref:Uncharacterized protein n=1 Tax=Pseudomonas putida TaxID=303 RepID=A0A8I1JHK2_PSEPU|nr:hypothetical protein [Pseudomonas putida]MBI6882771.1 hypothetical protein [Pseudomonas putida]
MKAKALPMAIALAIASLSTYSSASPYSDPTMVPSPEFGQKLNNLLIESNRQMIQASREYREAVQARDELVAKRDRNVLIEIEIQGHHETRVISGEVANNTRFSGRSVDVHEYVSSQVFVDGKLKTEIKDSVTYGQIFDVMPVITDDGKILVRVSLSHSVPDNPAEPTGPMIKNGGHGISAPSWSTQSVTQDLKLESGVKATLYKDMAGDIDTKGVVMTLKATIK